jgi:putative hydrolase of the HAD superfamily
MVLYPANIRVKSSVNFLLVDVDGVLVTGRPDDGRVWHAEMANDLGFSYDLLHEHFFKPYWDEIVTGRQDLKPNLHKTLVTIAPDLEVDAVIDYWFRHDARLNHVLLNDLSLARSRGIKVQLATNQEHLRADYLMNALGLTQYVDACHYSADIGFRKPHQAFFAEVALRVAAAPEHLMLIDDSIENVNSARSAGWQAAHWAVGATLSDILA